MSRSPKPYVFNIELDIEGNLTPLTQQKELDWENIQWTQEETNLK